VGSGKSGGLQVGHPCSDLPSRPDRCSASSTSPVFHSSLSVPTSRQEVDPSSFSIHAADVPGAADYDMAAGRIWVSRAGIHECL